MDIEARIAELSEEAARLEEEMEALRVMGEEEACVACLSDTKAEAVSLLEDALRETYGELGILRERLHWQDLDWECGGDGMPADEVTEIFGSYAKMNAQFV